MKFLLATAEVTEALEVNKNLELVYPVGSGYIYRSSKVRVSVASPTGGNSDKICSILRYVFENLYKEDETAEDFWTLQVGIGVFSTPNSNGTVAGFLQVKGVRPRNIMTALQNFTDSEAKVEVKLGINCYQTSGAISAPPYQIESSDMGIFGREIRYSHDHMLKMPEGIISEWEKQNAISAKYVITVTIPDEAVPGTQHL